MFKSFLTTQFAIKPIENNGLKDFRLDQVLQVESLKCFERNMYA